MIDKEAQPFTSMTRRRMCGTRWGTYLLKDKIVHAVCYQVEKSLLLEEEKALTRLVEWMWQLYKV